MQNENQNVGKCMVSPLGMNSSLQFFAMSWSIRNYFRSLFQLSAPPQVSLLQHLEIFPLTYMDTAWLYHQSSSRLHYFYSYLLSDNSFFYLLEARFSWHLNVCTMQTMYLVLVEKSGAEDGLSSVDLMFYNSILSLPFLFFLIIATGEFPHSLAVLSAKVSMLHPAWSYFD